MSSRFPAPGNGAAARPGMLRRRRERGAYAVLIAPLMIVILALCGLALDAGALFNRKAEVSGLARAVALAAAQELNGSAAGVDAARMRAREAAERFTVQYGLGVAWSDAALALGTSPARSGDWVPASGVANPSRYHFARVDTAALDRALGTVDTLFLQVLASGPRSVRVDEIAIAGRAAIDVLPIAVCAMSEDAAAERVNPGVAASELVEYGFRRGVSYDLMQLNPRGTTPARYLVNPVVPPGLPGAPFDPADAGPFACTGTMWMPSLKGGAVRVSQLEATLPLASLYTQLNSRLDDYTGDLCSVHSAPPDVNVRPYAYDKAGGAPWMSPAIGNPAAVSTTERGKLETVADIPPPGSTLSGINAGSYGPLWSYAKAVRFSSYTPGVPEPAGGYATLSTSDWAKLYAAGLSSNKYPSGSQASPYNPVGVSNPNTIAAPNNKRKDYATALRRVLNVPLLSCATLPAGANAQATVLGVGRFFMTVPATPASLVAEFAGMAPDQSLTGPVVLHP